MFQVIEILCTIGAGLGVAGVCAEMVLQPHSRQPHPASVEPRREHSLIEPGFSAHASLASVKR